MQWGEQQRQGGRSSNVRLARSMRLSWRSRAHSGTPKHRTNRRRRSLPPLLVLVLVLVLTLTSPLPLAANGIGTMATAHPGRDVEPLEYLMHMQKDFLFSPGTPNRGAYSTNGFSLVGLALCGLLRLDDWASRKPFPQS